MKLLLDQNLSFRILEKIKKIFPDSSQINLLSLDQASDYQVWQFAKENNYVIVSKDSDFHELSIRNGHPSKIIWLKCGNQTS